MLAAAGVSEHLQGAGTRAPTLQEFGAESRQLTLHLALLARCPTVDGRPDQVSWKLIGSGEVAHALPAGSGAAGAVVSSSTDNAPTTASCSVSGSWASRAFSSSTRRSS